MNETLVTVTGHVATDPAVRQTVDGLTVASFRVASTPRRYDGDAWKDGPSLFASVHCWRALGQNVAEYLRKGDPVIVTGRLSLSTWDGRDGQQRTTLDIDATAVGPDLSRGTTRFAKTVRQEPAAPASAVPGQAGIESADEPAPAVQDGAAVAA